MNRQGDGETATGRSKASTEAGPFNHTQNRKLLTFFLDVCLFVPNSLPQPDLSGPRAAG